MKIEVDIPEELIKLLGQEAVESYLRKKAEGLYQSVKNQATEDITPLTENKEASEKAWQKFNKRGLSC